MARVAHVKKPKKPPRPKVVKPPKPKKAAAPRTPGGTTHHGLAGVHGRGGGVAPFKHKAQATGGGWAR